MDFSPFAALSVADAMWPGSLGLVMVLDSLIFSVG